jgi:hypothetical protein
LADENAPAMPAVFGDEAEAWAKYDEVIRVVIAASAYSGHGPNPGLDVALGGIVAAGLFGQGYLSEPIWIHPPVS